MIGSVICGGLSTTGCRGAARPAPDVAVACRVEPDPPAVGPATVTITLSGPEARSVTGAKVTLEGTMSHPGMTPVFADAPEQGGGRYQAPLSFTMAGDWILIVSATLPDGARLQQQVEIRGVKAR